jgi:hypothetical protein
MATRPTAWQQSDAWVLLAVIHAAGEGCASLDWIVGVGDYLNHAIFLHEELAGGLDRLVSGGLVQHQQSGFAPTAVALSAHRSSPHRWAYQGWDLCETLLAAWPAPRPRRRSLVSAEAFDAAVETYLGRHRG